MRGLLYVVVEAESRCEAVVRGREVVRDGVVRVDGGEVVGSVVGELPDVVSGDVGFYYARSTVNVPDVVEGECGCVGDSDVVVEVDGVNGRGREWVVFDLGVGWEREVFEGEFGCSGRVFVYDGRGESVELVGKEGVFSSLMDECGEGCFAVLLSTKFA